MPLPWWRSGRGTTAAAGGALTSVELSPWLASCDAWPAHAGLVGATQQQAQPRGPLAALVTRTACGMQAGSRVTVLSPLDISLLAHQAASTGVTLLSLPASGEAHRQGHATRAAALRAARQPAGAKHQASPSSQEPTSRQPCCMQAQRLWAAHTQHSCLQCASPPAVRHALAGPPRAAHPRQPLAHTAGCLSL